MRIGSLLITTERQQERVIEGAQQRMIRRAAVGQDLAQNPEFDEMMKESVDVVFYDSAAPEPESQQEPPSTAE
jgi:hypothetical protein